jgi:hypothetical protein
MLVRGSATIAQIRLYATAITCLALPLATTMAALFVSGAARATVPARPEMWADTYCSATVAFVREVSRTHASLQKDGRLPGRFGEPRRVRSRLVSSAADLVQITNVWVAELEANGAPPLSSRAKIARAMRQLLSSAQASCPAVLTLARRIPVRNQSSFATEVGTLMRLVEARFHRLGRVLTRVDILVRSPLLDRLIDSTPACQAILALNS